jgi:hypothetical protein
MTINEEVLITVIEQALENMDRDFVKLSRIVDREISDEIIEKYQERPFAYEFYHQLRKLIDEGRVDLGGYFIQPEINKEYQHYLADGKIPDFIIHIPNAKKENLAVIEFKLATNQYIEDDFKKLMDFKTAFYLKYDHAIAVIIGNETSLKKANNKLMNKLNNHNGKEIIIVWFNTDTWSADDMKYQYLNDAEHAQRY